MQNYSPNWSGTDTDTDPLLEIAKTITQTEVTNSQPEATGRNYLIKETDTHYIEVSEQIFNWRVCSTPKDSILPLYDSAYCYLGKSVVTFTRAVIGAHSWNGPDDGDPPGYDKNALTGYWNK